MSEIICPQCQTTFTPESVEKAAIAEIERAIYDLELAKAELIKKGSQTVFAEEVESSTFRAKVLKTLDFLGLVEQENEVQASGSARKFANFLGLVDLEPAK